MLRTTLAGIIFAGIFCDGLRAADNPPEAVAAANSTVFFAQDGTAVTRFEENTAVTRRMVDSLIMAATGKKDVVAAWRSLVSPADRVGIKVSAAGGRYFSTHVGVVEAIVAGLEQSGIARSRIIVWDRDEELLTEARFGHGRGYIVRNVAPIDGYDRKADIAAPVLGRLIWGDVLFTGRLTNGLTSNSTADQLSSTSHLARVLSSEVTKVINVPVMSDEPGCGIAGALYNMTVPNVDNWRRFLQSDSSGTDSIPGVYGDERIGPKVVITIMDGLVAQYAGGPAGNPNYAFAHGTLYASKDPVAIDATALRRIEGWRKQSNLPPIGRRAEWLKSAQDAELGRFDEQRIELKEVSPSK